MQSNEVKIAFIIAAAVVLIAFSMAIKTTLTEIYAPRNPAQEKLSLIDRCVGSYGANNVQCTQIVLNSMKGNEDVQH